MLFVKKRDIKARRTDTVTEKYLLKKMKTLTAKKGYVKEVSKSADLYTGNLDNKEIIAAINEKPKGEFPKWATGSIGSYE